MSWHDHCHDFDSRVEASANDKNFNDISFLLTQEDAENPSGDKVRANKSILALISPTFYAQFYGPFSANVRVGKPIEIVDGTARGFKQMIDFIRHPQSYKIIVESAEEVFEISYFAHKYQLGSLISICRLFLGSYGEHDESRGFKNKDVLDTLQWAFSNQQLPVLYPAEHALLGHACWEQIVNNFKDIFPDGEINDDQFMPNEDLMMMILGNKYLSVDEGFLLTVAFNYFSKLIESESDYSIGHKRLKIDKEDLWNKKLDTIATIIKLEKVSPRKFSDILEKILNKIPQKIVINVMIKVSAGWKKTNSFKEPIRAYSYNPFIRFDLDSPLNDDEEDEDEEEDEKFTFVNCANKEVNIKFRINKNCIFKLNYISGPISDADDRDVKCISFQNGTDYEEFIEENWYGKTFFAKENTVITVGFEKLKHKDEIWMTQIERFHHSRNGFELDILEVNGEPVNNNSSCYSVLDNLSFLPI